MCPAISLEAVFPLRLVLRRARPGILELPSPSASDEWTYHRGRWRSGWAGPAMVPLGSDLPQLAPEQVSHMIIHAYKRFDVRSTGNNVSPVDAQRRDARICYLIMTVPLAAHYCIVEMHIRQTNSANQVLKSRIGVKRIKQDLRVEKLQTKVGAYHSDIVVLVCLFEPVEGSVLLVETHIYFRKGNRNES